MESRESIGMCNQHKHNCVGVEEIGMSIDPLPSGFWVHQLHIAFASSQYRISHNSKRGLHFLEIRGPFSFAGRLESYRDIIGGFQSPSDSGAM